MKVSIILPVYNKVKYVEKILGDVQKQTFENFECIIVDDGSTDGSELICDRYAQYDSRFRALHIANGGVSNARNVALDIAGGEYITFIDADDRIENNYLQHMMECANSSGADMVVGGHMRIWENGKREKSRMPYNGKYVFSDILPDFVKVQRETGIYGYCWAKLLPRQLIGTERFDINIKLAEDLDFYIRIYKKVGSIYFDPTPNYLYFQETENSSQIIDDYEIDYFTQLQIQLRIRQFTQEKNVYFGETEMMLEQIIQGYIFASLFYCDFEIIDEQYINLVELSKVQNITYKRVGGNVIQRMILRLFYHRNLLAIKIVLCGYRCTHKLLNKIRTRR